MIIEFLQPILDFIGLTFTELLLFIIIIINAMRSDKKWHFTIIL